MGLQLHEMVRNPDEGLCCGMAAGCNRYRPDDMYFAAVKELRAAAKTGADELATYCTGCHLTLAMMRWLYPTRQPVRHLLEYLQEAMGEAPYLPRPGAHPAHAGQRGGEGLPATALAQDLPHRD